MQHAPDCDDYRFLESVARPEVENRFGPGTPQSSDFGPFGKLTFPYHRMGTIDSLDLFRLDELILFSFYWVNRKRYRKVLDLGANIGLHSIVLSRCGYRVTAYEPDPATFETLQENLRRNGCGSVTPIQAAVATQNGKQEFIRLLSNHTGSHLSGAKPDPYGEMESFDVETIDYRSACKSADLVKMDIEGSEADILQSTVSRDWQNTDAIVEVSSPSNATAIYNHFSHIGVGLFAQRTGWAKVVSLDEMPTSYRDGSLFISRKSEMPWC